MASHNIHDIEEIVVLPVGGADAEAFPHVIEKLQLFWGEPEFLNYCDTLLHDLRGTRTGFPVHVLNELAFLRELYVNYYKEIIPRLTDTQIIDLRDTLKENDIWAQNYNR